MGVGAGAQASRTALKIFCKSFLEYLGILLAVTRASAKRSFVLEGLTGWSDHLLSNLGGGEKSKGATKRAAKRAIERRS